MQPDILKKPTANVPWLEIHSLSEVDSTAVADLRSVVAHLKGKLEGTAGRGPFNDIMERVATPGGHLRSRARRRNIRLVGQAAARSEGVRDHSRAWRLVHLGNGAGVSEP